MTCVEYIYDILHIKKNNNMSCKLYIQYKFFFTFKPGCVEAEGLIGVLKAVKLLDAMNSLYKVF